MQSSPMASEVELRNKRNYQETRRCKRIGVCGISDLAWPELEKEDGKKGNNLDKNWRKGRVNGPGLLPG